MSDNRSLATNGIKYSEQLTRKYNFGGDMLEITMQTIVAYFLDTVEGGVIRIPPRRAIGDIADEFSDTRKGNPDACTSPSTITHHVRNLVEIGVLDPIDTVRGIFKLNTDHKLYKETLESLRRVDE